MNSTTLISSPKVHLKWVADDAARRTLLAAQTGTAQVSDALPLRANLSVLENVAIVLQYRRNLDYDRAADLAWTLLARLGQTDCAFKRDPDLTSNERFAAKLARALILPQPIIIIERPGLLLPDTHYPPFLDACLAAVEDLYEQCWIVDYPWNEPLYAPR
jgi:ABC-type sugar transport system ATPase subunit